MQGNQNGTTEILKIERKCPNTDVPRYDVRDPQRSIKSTVVIGKADYLYQRSC